MPAIVKRRRTRASSDPIVDLSRAAVLREIHQAPGPVGIEDLGAALGADDLSSIELIAARLRALAEGGEVVRLRDATYAAAALADTCDGAVMAHRDGYGFVTPEDGGPDVFLPPRQMRNVMHGDRVRVRIIRFDRQGRPEGALVSVLERDTTHMVGRFFREGSAGRVVPDGRSHLPEVRLIPSEATALADGEVVVVELAPEAGSSREPRGRIVERLGEIGAPGMEIDIAIRAHGLPHEWPDAAASEAAGIALEPQPEDYQGRVDLRDRCFVTIDGADAKDFDDAVYAEARENGWYLEVAIADVGAYVTPDSALDLEARRRGTSVYFPGRVVPMLPERLSNGVCSLNPKVDRLVMVCRMHFDARGRIRRSDFVEGVIRSQARLTYEEVEEAIVEGELGMREQLDAVVPMLDTLYALYRVLKRERARRGAIELDSVEPQVVLGTGQRQRRIERIEGRARLVAHQIIEEAMIAANVCAARFVERHKLPALYRVHEGPKEEKLAELALYLRELGLRFDAGAKVTPTHYADVLGQASQRPDARVVQTVMLRSLSQAVYQPKNIGHFGLALPAYAHFTSPIRRYPDLLLHRVIRARLRKEEPRYDREQMQGLGRWTSQTERRAEDAVRDALSWLKCEYMEDKIGMRYSGMVSGVTSFGLFVEIPELLVDGLVHISTLGSDFFHHDPLRHRLEGERSGTIYRLAQPVEVEVVNVDAQERRIDFELAGEVDAGRGGRARRSGHRRSSRSRAGRRKAARRG